MGNEIFQFVPHIPGVPLHSFRTADGRLDHVACEDLLLADLIIGRDTMSKHEFLVLGRDVLEGITSGRTPSREARILVVELDQNTDDLEMLIALVRVKRGTDDYNR
jgi:hypothetical protein